MKPLQGIRVLELGALVAAPFCGMLLADLGADVIKVEPPEGDMAREFAPFVEGESAFFMAVNRGKRSVALDVRDPDALECVKRIAAKSDVVIHNFRTGVVERLGLDDETLRSANPGLVYCEVSGFGPTGPYAGRPGIDLIFQAESGMLAVTGTRDSGPVKIGTNAADVYAATTAALCITSALVSRSMTGRGCRIDVSLRDALLSLQACWFSSFLATGQQPERLGCGSPFTAPTDVYPTADGGLVVAVVNEKHWRIFCDTLGLSQAAVDARFSSNALRVEHAEELRFIVSQVLQSRSTAEWLEVFATAGIPAGAVLDYAAVAEDPQIRHNGMVVEMPHSKGFTVQMAGTPFWFDRAKAISGGAPPALGEHTHEILVEAGCPSDAVDRLTGR